MIKKQVKGFIPKKEVAKPSNLMQDIESVSTLVSDLRNVKKELISEFDQKVSEVDSVVENAAKQVDESKQDFLKVKKDTESVLSTFKSSALAMIESIKKIPHIRGNDADEEAIISKILGELTRKDSEIEERVMNSVLSAVPKLDKKELLAEVLSSLPKNDFDIDEISEKIKTDPMEIIKVILSLPVKDFQLTTKHIKGLDDILVELRNRAATSFSSDKSGMRGGGDTVVAGTNVTLTRLANGSVQINCTSSSAVDSVFGRTGAVIAQAGDYTTALVTSTVDNRYVTDAQLVVIGNTSGVNTGDQTSIVGITGTKAQFDTACTDGNFLYVGDIVGVTDGDKGDITVSSTGTVWTIDNDAVTYAKIQNVSAASKLLGRGDSGSGDVQEITLGSGLTMTGTTLSATGGASVNFGITGQVPYMNATDDNFDYSDNLVFGEVSAGVWTLNVGPSLIGVVKGGGATGEFRLDGSGGPFNIVNVRDTRVTIDSGYSFFINTNGIDQLAIDDFGAWLLNTDAGTAGYVLTSNGAGTAPTWQAGGGGGLPPDADYGDITVSSSGTVWTIDAQAVSLSKMADVATATVFYRKTAGAGSPEVQTLATLKTDLGLSGTNTGDQTITLTGDVTGSGTGSFAATIANNAVTLAKMDTMATDSILGRATAGTGNVEVLTALPFAYTGDVTRPADSNATTIANNAVTLAKMATMVTDSILGRATAGTGNVEVLTALPFAFTGDVTRAADSNAQTIATAAVTLAKMADMATSSLIYRKTAGTGVPEVNTLATLKTDLGLTGTNSGDVTLAGSPNYITIAGQVITRALIDLTSHVTGDLPFANLAQGSARSVLGVTGNSTADVASIQGTSDQVLVINTAGTALAFGTVATAGITNDAVTYAKIQNVSAASKILGRGSAGGSGDVEEITIGSGLSMSGTTLSATGGGGGISLGLVNMVRLGAFT